MTTVVNHFSLTLRRQFGRSVGLRQGLSADLLRLMEEVPNALELRHSIGAVFPDYAHAFDSVWYDGLLFKMGRFGIN